MIIDKALAKVFGTANERELKRLHAGRRRRSTPSNPPSRRSPTSSCAARRPSSARASRNGETLDDLLPEAFAVVREAGRRVLNMRHFDVQLIGGMVLHRGKIARDEDRRRQDARRDAARLSQRARRQGRPRRHRQRLPRPPRLGVDGPHLPLPRHDASASSSTTSTTQERQVAYAADITYGTNNEFGFDYLRDNMKFDLAHYVQRGHHFAIVDEVDTHPDRRSADAAHHLRPGRGIDRPLLRGRSHHPAPRRRARSRSGDVKAEDREELEKTGDYIVDEKHKTVTLTESGMAKAEKMLAHRLEPDTDGLYDPANMPLLHHVNQALARTRCSTSTSTTWSRTARS